MAFLALMAAVVLYHLWGPDGPLHDEGWYRAWERSVAGFGFMPWVSLTLAVAAPSLLAGWLLDAIDSILFGVFWLGAAVILLLYSFGWLDYHTALERYVDHCDRGDMEGAWLASRDPLALDGLQPQPETPEQMHDTVWGALLFEGYQRWFPVVFWFVLLGPAGALAYRLVALASEGELRDTAVKLRHAADFLPVRAVAVTFALAGDFVRCRQDLQAALADTELSARDALSRVARGAIGAVDADAASVPAWEMRETSALLKRSAGAWLVAISLVAILA